MAAIYSSEVCDVLEWRYCCRSGGEYNLKHNIFCSEATYHLFIYHLYF
jgi:hypothetical protein